MRNVRKFKEKIPKHRKHWLPRLNGWWQAAWRHRGVRGFSTDDDQTVSSRFKIKPAHYVMHVHRISKYSNHRARGRALHPSITKNPKPLAEVAPSHRSIQAHHPIYQTMKVTTMISTGFFACASAFAPRANLAFKNAGARAFSRSSVSMMANPQGWFSARENTFTSFFEYEESH